jgi:hypothetical protein
MTTRPAPYPSRDVSQIPIGTVVVIGQLTVSVRRVEPGDQVAVGGAGCLEVVVALGDLAAVFDGLLFEFGDAALEGVDVWWGSEPGFSPGLLAEQFR